jgi:hypothetical protein
MRTSTRLLAILGGFGVAFALAILAVQVRLWLTDTPDAQASAGMYAFVDGMLFLAVLGLLSLPPTVALLTSFGSSRALWTAIAALALLVALSGLVAVGLFATLRFAPSFAANPTFELWAGLSVLRLLPAPLIFLALALAAAIAPPSPARRALVASLGVEAMVGAAAATFWL